MAEIKFYISDIQDFNLALHVWEENEAVINRKILALKLWIKEEKIIYLNQVHSDRVIVFEDENILKYEWDAIVTNKQNYILSILVADCMPIILYDEETNIIWAVHAWWRGTKDNIVWKTLEKMFELWAKRSNIKAIIWPWISQNSYEVWKEVWKYFREEVKKDLWNTKDLLDLKEENKLQLLEYWIELKNIGISSVDTFSNNNYFSARRENIWRFWIFIWIE